MKKNIYKSLELGKKIAALIKQADLHSPVKFRKAFTMILYKLHLSKQAIRMRRDETLKIARDTRAFYRLYPKCSYDKIR